MYTAATGAKMSGVERTYGESSDARAAYSETIKRKYRAPLAQMNTNAAYTLATQLLAAASFDVPAMERAARPEVYAWLDGGEYFVPLYIVLFPGIAELHLVEPEKVLLSLSVNKPQYIKRRKLSLPNRDWLLQQTDDPKMRERWLTTDAYKASALNLMLEEAARASRLLGLPQPIPLTSSNLAEYSVQPPYFSDRLGILGTIATEEYIFTFRPANKLGFVSKNFRLRGDEAEYRASLKDQHTLPASKIDTTNAYALATQWLSTLAVDVPALCRDCPPKVTWWDLGTNFVPLYKIEWRHAKPPRETAVAVELLWPQRSLIRLVVDDPKYLQRKPLALPSREELLRATNGPPRG